MIDFLPDFPLDPFSVRKNSVFEKSFEQAKKRTEDAPLHAPP